MLFHAELTMLLEQASPSWDPHTKLGYMKTAIRIAAFERQSIYKKNTNKEYEENMSKLNVLQDQLAL
jgi:hypothetical protein